MSARSSKGLNAGLPLRVVCVLPCEPGGAGFVFAKRQVNAIEQAGVTVQRFFLRSRLSPLGLIGEFRRFRRVIRQFDPHIVHAHFGTITAFFCAVTTTTPMVITYRGSDLNPLRGAGRLRHSFARFLSQLASLRAARIICVSDQLASRLWWPRARAGTHILPVGVNTEVFRVMARSEARRALEWEEDGGVVLFNASRPYQRSNKRLDLAEAAARVAESLAGNIQLVVLDGLTSPERIPLMMNAADCLLLTSDYEGSPNVVKEAMACALPVVTVDVGDVVERLRDVHPSRIVARDPQALGLAICDVLKQGRRSNGREIVERDLAEAVTVKKVLDVYQKALHGGNPIEDPDHCSVLPS